jgi:regulator of nucleoside diphosphate kinase
MQALMTDVDMLRVAECLDGHLRWPGHDREGVQALRRKLNTANVVSTDDIPSDVVTLDSRVRVTDVEAAFDATYTVVMNGRPSSAANTVSVLSPVGVALLGRREGDEVGYWENVVLRRLRVKGVLYQPESAARASRNEWKPLKGGSR